MLNKKGVFLIYVLFTAVLISVFLITAVSNMHNSYFLTTKFTGENKAYWASEAGIQYCEYKIKSDVCWPFNKPIKEKVTYGPFTIESTPYDSAYYIYGYTKNKSEEFHIYFSKKKKKIIENGEEFTSIAPPSFPSDTKDLAYCSYTSLTKSSVTNTYNEGKDDHSTICLVVSKKDDGNEHKAMIKTPGVYIISDGRSRAYRAVTERMFIVDNANTSAAGLYSGGDININLVGNNSQFKITQKSNSKPEVYCRSNLNIIKNATDTNKYVFPLSAKTRGTIYFGQKGGKFKIIDNIQHDNSFSTETTAYSNFKRQYGVNLQTFTKSQEELFPKLTWEKIEQIRDKKAEEKEPDNSSKLEKIESGSYVAIYEDLKLNLRTADLKAKYPHYKGYALCKLNNNYMKSDGTFDEQKLADDIKAAEEKAEEAKQIINNANQEPVYETNENGELVQVGTKLSDRGADLIEIKNSDRGLIREFIKKLNGLQYDPNTENEDADQYIYCSAKPGEKDKSKIFKIESVVINENTEDNPNKSTTNETPIITLKKSIETLPNSEGKSFFSLFTMTRQKDETANKDIFKMDDKKSTDLVFAKKNNGVSENNYYSTHYSDDDSEDHIEYNREQYSLIPNKDSTMLFTNGNITINGKLSGTGQILSSGDVYFRAGTQLNTNDYTNPITKQHEYSKVGVYSMGNIQMGIPEKRGDLSALYTKIQEKLANKKGGSYDSIANSALYSRVKITDEDRKKVKKEIHDNEVSLMECMTKYYGFSYGEAHDYLDDLARENAIYDDSANYSNRYKTPSEPNEIRLFSYQQPSSFSGIIYSCGEFITDANNGSVTINGVLIAYGGNPANSVPGSSGGSINIERCSDFSVIYDSSDLENLRRLCFGKRPINLTCIYFNRL